MKEFIKTGLKIKDSGMNGIDVSKVIYRKIIFKKKILFIIHTHSKIIFHLHHLNQISLRENKDLLS